MRTKIFASILLTVFAGLLPPTLRAQSGPHIVWQTNAHTLEVNSVNFSADSSRLASGSRDRHSKVWSVPGEQMLTDVYLSTDMILSTALSSNGTYLATGGDNGRLCIWRVSDGSIYWQLSVIYGSIYATAFSPDGVHFADSRTEYEAYIRKASNGAFVLRVDHGTTVNSITFSPDGALLASGGNDDIARITRLADTNTLFTLTGHSADVISVDFSPDGSLLLTGAADGTSRLWNITNGACVRVIEGAGGQAKFSANGKIFFTLNESLFQIWRVSNGALVGSITNTGAFTFDVSKNGKYLAYAREDDNYFPVTPLVLAQTPLVLDAITRTGNETVLNWQGGSGLYQLQSNTNFTTNGWQNLGPATTNTVATNVSSSTLFFRVQSLPNP